MLSKQEAEEEVKYHPSTGLLSRKKSRGNQRLGSVNLTIDGKGYYRISIKGKRYKSHHVVWLLHYGVFPSQLDHINGVKTDNRIENLREATTQQNCHYRISGQKKNRVGLPGVTLLASGKYKSQAQILGQKVYLGQYETAQEAYEKYLNCKQGATV